MSTTAILLAAGSGSRMQGTVTDKILAPLNGKPVFIHSIQAFIDASIVDHIQLVYRDEAQHQKLATAIEAIELGKITLSFTQGGKERQDSVYAALKAQSEHCERVYIHDCARPFVSLEALHDLKNALNSCPAAVLAHRVVDTIKRLPSNDITQAAPLEDLDRSRLWAMETPQAFDYRTILTAYQTVNDRGEKVTDDTAVAARMGIDCKIVPNARQNPKITNPEDLAFLEWYCQSNK